MGTRSELIEQIDKVAQWGQFLNSDDGPLDLGEAMAKIKRLATRVESQLEVERYRNQGIKPWGKGRE